MSLRIVLNFALTTLIWGATWIVIKEQLGVVPPSWSVSYRFLAAGALLFGYAVLSGRRLSHRLSTHGLFLALALTQFVLNFNFVYHAERYVTSGLVAAAYALLMLPNALLAWAVLRQPVSRRFMVGGLLGIFGVGLLFRSDMQAGINDAALFGLGLVACGILSASVANVLQASRTAAKLDLVVMLAWAMIYGGLIDAAFAWIVSGPPRFDPSPAYVGGLAYLAALGSALAFVLYFDLIRLLGPARAAYSGVMVPFLAMLLSTWFEGYRWTPAAAFGGVLALSGLVLALRSRKSR